MKAAYTAEIHGQEFICITLKAPANNDLFRIAMNYKTPVNSNLPHDNLLFFGVDVQDAVLKPFKIVGKLVLMTDYLQVPDHDILKHYGITYKDFYDIKYLYFRTQLK